MNNQYERRWPGARRVLAILLTVMMVLTGLQIPVSAASGTSVKWVTDTITPETTSVEVEIQSLPNAGILRVVQMDAGDSYESAQLNSYASLNFSLLTDLKEGRNTLALSKAPEEGKKLLAVVRDASVEPSVDYVAAAVTVTDPSREDPGDNAGENPDPEDPGDNAGENPDPEDPGDNAGEDPDPKEDPSDSQSEVAIAIDGAVTSSAKEIPIRVTGDLPEGAVISVRGYASSHTDIDYTSVWTGNGDYNFNIGTLLNATAASDRVTVTGDSYLVAGLQLVAYVLDAGSPIAHSDITVVRNNGSLADKADEILQNCSVKLLADADLPLETSEIGVQVGLASRVDSCTMTIYEVPQNIAFDSDAAAYFRSLWSGTVTDGFSQTVRFREEQLPLKAYHKLVAVLNVPIDTAGDGFYRTKESEAVYILDENGERFKSYEYPDIRIDETELEAGATSLHLTLTGDARLFEAAKSDEHKDFSIHYAVGMYPADETFDFEGEHQIGLLNYGTATEPFSGEEITFAEPLREGYRVRAVVYWSQDESLFIAQGNDYEEMFHRPDDSVLVKAASNEPKVAFSGNVVEGDAEAKVALSGEIPDGAMISVKKFPAGTAAPEYDDGAVVAFAAAPVSGENTVSFNSSYGSAAAGDVLVAYLLVNYEPAVSGQTVVQTAPAPSISIPGKITTESTGIPVELDGKIPENAKIILFTYDEDATSFPRDYSVGKFLASVTSGVGKGSLTVDLGDAALEAGRQVVAFLVDSSFDNITQSEAVRILDPASELVISLGSVQTDSETVDVEITGALPDGAMLLVKSYPKDATEFRYDQGEAHGVTSGLQAGTTKHTLTNAEKLSAGRKLVAYVLAGGKAVSQSEPVVVIQGAYETPTIRILDRELTAGDAKLHYQATFDKALEGATYAVYRYTSEAFDPEQAEKLAGGTLTKSAESVVFIKDKIRAGDHLTVALTVQGETIYADPITVEPSPDWGGAEAGFTVESLKDDAESIPVRVNYSEEYLNKYGEDFYCDVTVYMFDSSIDDDMFEEGELWEKAGQAAAVAKVNSTYGDVTRGDLEIPILAGASLEAGKKLIIKVRLPHTEWVDEWDDEEEDFLSASIPIRPGSEFAYGPSVLLYHVDFDTARGKTIRKLLEDHGIQYKVVTEEDFGQQIGYLLELKGYEAAGTAYEGNGYSSEFMLMHASDYDRWSEIFLADGGFIDLMRANGVAIDYKASSTPTNQIWTLGTLIGEIMEEHEVMTAWIALNKVTETAGSIDEATYGGSDNWADFLTALENAKAALATEEEDGLTPELLEEANDRLTAEMRNLTADAETTAKLETSLRSLVEENGAKSEELYGNSVNWKDYQKALEEARALLQEEHPNAGALALAGELLRREADALTAGTAKTSLKSAKVTLKTTTYTYNGKARKPAVQVTLDGKTLAAGTDYTVTYSGNTNVGKATALVTGKNRYQDTASASFTIKPKGTTLQKVKKGSKRMVVTWKKQAKQITGYQLQYSTNKKFKKGNKTLTIAKPKEAKRVVKKLKSKKTYYVRIRTYKKVGGKTYYSGWSKVKKVKVK